MEMHLDSPELNRHEGCDSEDDTFDEGQPLGWLGKDDREIGFLNRDLTRAGRGVNLNEISALRYLFADVLDAERVARPERLRLGLRSNGNVYDANMHIYWGNGLSF
jgi:hypothetical protein